MCVWGWNYHIICVVRLGHYCDIGSCVNVNVFLAQRIVALSHIIKVRLTKKQMLDQLIRMLSMPSVTRVPFEYTHKPRSLFLSQYLSRLL